MNQQTTFTDTEAQAIAGMIAKLTSEGYITSISAGGQREIEGDVFETYCVDVTDDQGNQIARGDTHYFLIDALSDAYMNCPEKLLAQ